MFIGQGNGDFAHGDLPNQLLSGDIHVQPDIDLEAGRLHLFEPFLVGGAPAHVHRLAGQIAGATNPGVVPIGDDLLAGGQVAVGKGHLTQAFGGNGQVGRDHVGLTGLNVRDHALPAFGDLQFQANAQVIGKGLSEIIFKTHRLAAIQVVGIGIVAGQHGNLTGAQDAIQRRFRGGFRGKQVDVQTAQDKKSGCHQQPEHDLQISFGAGNLVWLRQPECPPVVVGKIIITSIS